VADRDTHRTLTHLIRACDVRFGSTSMALAALATARWLTGHAAIGIVVALWAAPAANITGWRRDLVTNLISSDHMAANRSALDLPACRPAGDPGAWLAGAKRNRGPRHCW